jgi:hypothetical protein
MISAFIHGKMAACMRDFTLKIRSKAMVFILGAIRRNTLAGGSEANNTALVFSSLGKEQKESSASGRMERKSAGSQRKMFMLLKVAK